MWSSIGEASAGVKHELDEQTIIRALRRLSDLLGEREITGEVCLLGGAVMVLAYRTRAATKDVDAIFQPAQIIRELARSVQEEMDLPENWINDGAKAFVSPRHEAVAADLPQFEHLRVLAPTPEYMLAMKCMASRIPARPEDHGDLADIAFLVHHLRLASAEEALTIVARYYPEDQVPVRARFVIEDIFSQGSPH
jgi:hypothetical protein